MAGGLDQFCKLLLHAGEADASIFTNDSSNYATYVSDVDKTVLMLHFDGADAAVATKDAATNKAVTFVGTAQLDTAQSKFGGSSLLLDGNSDYVSLADSNDFDLPADFTIEGWFNFAANNANMDLCGNGYDGGWMIEYLSNGRLGFYVNSACNVLGSAGTFTPSASTWYHIAVCRVGTTCKIYVNGTEHATGTEATSITSGNELFIGRDHSDTAYFGGWIDDVLIIKGKALYTANFGVHQSSGNIYDEDMAVITDWTDADRGTGDSSQVTFDGKSCMKLDTGANTASESVRTIDVGTFGTRTVFSMNVYNDSIGTMAQGDRAIFWAYDGSTRLIASFCSDGLYVYDGASQNNIGNWVVQDAWQEWTFDVNWTAQTLDIYLDGVLKASGVDCSSASATANGTVTFSNADGTTANRITYIDWFKAGTTSYPITVSPSPKDVTCVGNAQIDTAQKEFGTGSILFDGTGDYLSLADSDDWNFGSGNFTIDFWVRYNALPAPDGYQMFCGQYVDATHKWEFYFYNSAGTYICEFYANGGSGAISLASGTITPVVNTWYHMAVVRNGNDFALYVDGTSFKTGSDADTMPDVAAPLFVGYNEVGSVNGWIDEFRISKGIARWTSDFTPPTSEYSTTLDDHFDATALSLTSTLGTHAPIWGGSFTATALTLNLTQHIAIQVVIIENSLVLTLYNPTVTISSSVTTTVQELTATLNDPTTAWGGSVSPSALELTATLAGGSPFLITAILRRTYTFGATENVTNEKLHNLIETCIFDMSNQTAGDMFSFNGTKWMRLAKGADGKVMKMVSGVPAWA